MGYKSVLRSINSTSNQIIRQAERERRQAARTNKKIETVYSKRDSILDALEKEYASGKVSAEKFRELKDRMNDVGLELVVLGKTAGVTLGKRYVCGKINKEEFDQIQKEILPSDFFEEKEGVLADYNKRKEAIELFRNQCNKNEEGKCQKCLVPKSFFRRLSLCDDFMLCGSCKKELTDKKTYPGFSGKYFTAKAGFIGSDGKTLQVLMKEEFLLS